MLSGTARRLRLAMVVLVASFLGTAAAAFAGLAEMHDLLHSVKEQETRVRYALALATAVRDQYAHQAHTIIIGDRSHLPLYVEAKARVDALLEELTEAASSAGGAEEVRAIRTASEELDALFTTRILPVVGAGERARLLNDHRELLRLVATVQAHADALATRHEASISGFEAHAEVVQHNTFVWMLAFACTATAVAIGFSAFIGRAVTRPLTLLEAGAFRLAQGDLSTRIDLRRPDEFGRLAEQINRMTSALKEQQERLVQSEKLAGIGRLAAGVAHELNNPVGVILGYARILARTETDARRADLKIIEEEALRCQEIVEGLLDLARPAKPGADLVDLRALAEEVAARLMESGQMQHVSITVRGEAAVEGSAPRLRQLVTNILRNAAEACGAHGDVSVSLEEANGIARAVVADSGPGLSEEALDKLFEPFFTTKAGGTGLGLAISRAIAQAHGGEVRARNASGGGAQLMIELPKGG